MNNTGNYFNQFYNYLNSFAGYSSELSKEPEIAADQSNPEILSKIIPKNSLSLEQQNKVQKWLDFHFNNSGIKINDLHTIIKSLIVKNSDREIDESLATGNTLIKLYLQTGLPISLVVTEFLRLISLKKDVSADEILTMLQNAFDKMMELSHLLHSRPLAINNTCQMYALFIEAEHLTHLYEDDLKRKGNFSSKEIQSRRDAYFLKLISPMTVVAPNEELTLETGLFILHLGAEIFCENPKGHSDQTNGHLKSIIEFQKKYSLSESRILSLIPLYQQGISIAALDNLLKNCPDEREKEIMLSTIAAVQKKLLEIQRGDEVYEKKQSQEGVRKSHAFAIFSNDIYIVKKRNVLGRGGFKEVSKAISLRNPDKEFVRAKSVFKKDVSLNKQAKVVNEMVKEGKLLDEIRRDMKLEEVSYIVPAYNVTIKTVKMTGESRCVMFQEKMDGDGKKLFYAELHHKLYALCDCAHGFAALHKQGRVHMDAKPANLLFQGDLKSSIPVRGKLADFGFSHKVGQLFGGGSLAYISPEQHEKIKQNQLFEASPQFDAFGMGAIIYEVVRGDDSLVRVPDIIYGLLGTSKMKILIENEKNRVREKPFFLIGLKENNPFLIKWEKSVRIQIRMLEIAQKLLEYDPQKRISCAKAALELEEIINTEY